MDVQRLRTRNTQIPTTIKSKIIASNGSLIREDEQQSSYIGTYATCDDVNHVGYNRRRKTGELIIDPAIITKTMRDYTGSEVNFLGGSYAFESKGDLFPALVAPAGGGYPSPTQLISTENLRNKAIISLYNKMNGSTVSGGENLATMGQTLRMMKSPFKSALNLFSDMYTEAQKRLMRRGQMRTGVSMTAILSDVWLEGIYGHLPLLYDVANLATAYSDASSKLAMDFYVARGGAKTRSNESASFSGTASGELNIWSGMKCTGTRVTDLSVRTGTGAFFSFVNNDAASLAGRTLGLRAIDLPRLAWDLMPYSFVVDWWVNVGDWITAAVPNPELVILGKWLSTVRVQEEHGSGNWEIMRYVSGNPSGSDRTFTGSMGSETITTVDYQRAIVFDLPSTPVVNLSIGSLSHALSGLALARQNIHSVLSLLRH